MGMAKPVFATPMLAVADESRADTGHDARDILGVNVLLPETDRGWNGRSTITEQTCEALGPNESTGSYIPIPNCIVRSPGNDLKMVLALKRIVFRYCAILSFIGFASVEDLRR